MEAQVSDPEITRSRKGSERGRVRQVRRRVSVVAIVSALSVAPSFRLTRFLDGSCRKGFTISILRGGLAGVLNLNISPSLPE